MIHIVVAALVNDNLEVLLLRRIMDREHAAGKWHVVAGHIEPGESPDDALKRELNEELGVAHYTVLKKGKSFIYHHDPDDYEVNAYKIKAEQPLKVNPSEHDQWEWVPVDKIRKYDIMPYLAKNLVAVEILI